ncbi:MAG: hypothetical protein ACREOG_16050, partial [Gemmatimonadaceae bacterium]
MRRRLALVVSAVLLSVATFTAPSAAAQANVRIGGFLGMEFDWEDDWLIFGAEARIRPAGLQFDFQPRFHYQSFTGGSSLQLDGNILFSLTSLVPQIQPYMGFGAALYRLDRDTGDPDPAVDDDETHIGLNLITGLIFGTNATWRPYIH